MPGTAVPAEGSPQAFHQGQGRAPQDRPAQGTVGLEVHQEVRSDLGSHLVLLEDDSLAVGAYRNLPHMLEGLWPLRRTADSVPDPGIHPHRTAVAGLGEAGC